MVTPKMIKGKAYCGTCKWFRDKQPHDKQTTQDKTFSHFCGINLYGVNPESYRCGGDDYWEEPSQLAF